MRYFEMQGEERRRKIEKRLEREMRVWSNLSHRNIIPFLGFCYFPNSSHNFSLVSPWMENGTAIAYVKNNPHIDRLPIMVGIFRGIRYLHHNGIVHGDIKPSNILMSDKGVPLLGDFGLAKLQRGDLSMMEHVDATFVSVSTATQEGTTRYMAPELFLDPGPSGIQPKPNFQTDVWAFGCVLLEIITLLPPYSACKSDLNALSVIISGRLPFVHSPQSSSSAFPEAFRPHPGIWFLCLRCWEKDVGTRVSLPEVRDWLRNHTQYRGPPNVETLDSVTIKGPALGSRSVGRHVKQRRPRAWRISSSDIVEHSDGYILSNHKLLMDQSRGLPEPRGGIRHNPPPMLRRYDDDPPFLNKRRHTLEIMRCVHGVDHSETLRGTHEFMLTLEQCGVLEDAIEIGADLVLRLWKKFGGDDFRLHESVTEYGRILRRLGKNQEAARWENVLTYPVDYGDQDPDSSNDDNLEDSP
ncbi:kinase-like protein [Sistotremastrum suecicum HHB10207 ss-3]|uniref:Kinase-like protein n=1 Tax=Sistotremastrum suecicum HHB10207 ss-3 TaxID=1314776 RepID=A0A165Z7I2_9AGAM|nr:kinase-like protein [Sistotremastrum suecicum HHB10207 ss-3]